MELLAQQHRAPHAPHPGRRDERSRRGEPWSHGFSHEIWGFGEKTSDQSIEWLLNRLSLGMIRKPLYNGDYDN